MLLLNSKISKMRKMHIGGKMQRRISTKYILNEFDISRQTLHNWIQEGLLNEPNKDWRGWRIWTQEDLNHIQKLLCEKAEKNLCIKEHNDDAVLEMSNRRYLGSKQKLIYFIDNIIKENVGDFNTFFEPFAGTGVVSNYYNNHDKIVIVNDILKSNYIAYDTFFGTEEYDTEKLIGIIKQLNAESVNDDNYISENFGNRYFTIQNARKIGYIRDKVDVFFEQSFIDKREKNILITSLLYAADKVANTCGHYDAYREKLDNIKDLKLLMPNINDKANMSNQIYNCDANDLVRKIQADVTYIDTPYNSRQYGDAYHLLENIAENKKTELQGKAKKIKKRNHIKSNYCTIKAVETFRDLIENVRTKHVLVSYNNMARKGNGRSNAKISNEEIVEILSQKGEVKVFETDFNAFTAGKSKIDNHKEMIYYCRVI